MRRKAEAGIKFAKNLAANHFVEEGYLTDDAVQTESFKKSFIKVGVHSTPSMSNLHIHVLTKDMNLPWMKNKKHYNSFCTDFFVELGMFENESIGDGGKLGIGKTSLGTKQTIYDTSSASNSTDSFDSGSEKIDASETNDLHNNKNFEVSALLRVDSKSPQLKSANPIRKQVRQEEENGNGKKNFQNSNNELISYSAAQVLQLKNTSKQRPVGTSVKRHESKRLANLLNNELKCVHCGKHFGTRFSLFKTHLRGEFVGRFGG